MNEVLVIGAGIGGLAAGLSLVSQGTPVRILEAQGTPGGKAGRVEREGLEFDTGPSVLTLPEVFDRIFVAAGSSLKEQLQLIEPSPAFDYRWPDGTRVLVEVRLPDTLASVGRSLGPDAERELADFLRYAETIWETAAPHFVYGPAPSAASLLRLGLSGFQAVRQIDPLHTMAQAIEGRIQNRYLRDLLGRYATYNGSDLRAAPATLNCIAHVELGLGAYGIAGGLRALVQAMVGLFERRGGRLECGARVERLCLERGRVVGVELADGRRLPGAQVIVNADAAHLTEALLPKEQRKVLGAPGPPSTSGWTGLIKARRRAPAELVAHTVLFPERYSEEFVDLFDRQRPPADPTVYLCAQGRAHAHPGWPEHEPIFVMANAPAEPAQGESDPALQDQLEAQVLAKLEATGLFRPQLDRLIWSRRPRDLAQAFPGSRGGIYGAASNSTFAAFRRPPNRIPAVPGLYLASGSAHPGGGVPLCALSGVTAAEAVRADRGQA